jgi:hypothetical protein
MKPDKHPIELYQKAKEDRYKADKNDPIRLLAYLDKMGIDFNKEGAKIKEGDSRIIYNALCDLTRANLKALAARSDQIRQLQEEVKKWKRTVVHVSDENKALESLLLAEKEKHGQTWDAALK